MNKLERKMIRFVCEEAYVNQDENPYKIYVNLGDYFHKKVCFVRCMVDTHKGYMITISRDGSRTGYLQYLGHNLEVIEQYKTLEELNKDFQLCKDYNEY